MSCVALKRTRDREMLGSKPAQAFTFKTNFWQKKNSKKKQCKSTATGGAVSKQQDTWWRDSGFEAHSRLENLQNAENVEKMTGYSPWSCSMLFLIDL